MTIGFCFSTYIDINLCHFISILDKK